MPYQTPGMNPTGAVCPKCGSPQAKPVSFTWWGGILGPKLLSHVKCLQCGAGYNSKTGRSNDTAIAIYLVVACAIGLVLVLLLLLAR